MHCQGSRKILGFPGILTNAVFMCRDELGDELGFDDFDDEIFVMTFFINLKMLYKIIQGSIFDEIFYIKRGRRRPLHQKNLVKNRALDNFVEHFQIDEKCHVKQCHYKKLASVIKKEEKSLM